MDAHREALRAEDPQVFELLRGEEQRQCSGIELIPSENYTYPEVLALLGSVFTNKYSEGYPGKRYYGGQDYTDPLERLAQARACELFRCEHANVQPLSGSPMNQAVYLAFMQPGDTLMAMDLSHGGHLTHGSPVSHMGKLFNIVRYKTLPDEKGRLDFDELLRLARETRPKILLCGTTSHPRDNDYAAFKRAADEVGAITMADVSHIGGLIAGGALANPFDFDFDVVTTTTHKSLRGPRGGMVLCKQEHAARIDKSVFPGLQGGPHMNQVAATAVTLKKALEPEFKQYAAGCIRNARSLAAALISEQVELVTGGTDTHMLVMDTARSFDLDGRVAERALDQIAITTNKQIVPDDPRPPLRPSGVRLGTPAATTRGMNEDDMRRLAIWMVRALRAHDDKQLLTELRGEVESLCTRFPVPGLPAAQP